MIIRLKLIEDEDITVMVNAADDIDDMRHQVFTETNHYLNEFIISDFIDILEGLKEEDIFEIIAISYYLNVEDKLEMVSKTFIRYEFLSKEDQIKVVEALESRKLGLNQLLFVLEELNIKIIWTSC